MRSGRNLQPVDLILAKGNKSRLSKKEIEKRRKAEERVKGRTDNIQAPDYLPKNLCKKFDDLSGQLVEMDLMDNLDADSLARYVISEYNYQRVMKKVNRLGVDNPDFYDMTLLAEKYFKMARQSASDMGLSITSRLKLAIPKVEEKEENKFMKFAK